MGPGCSSRDGSVDPAGGALLLPDAHGAGQQGGRTPAWDVRPPMTRVRTGSPVQRRAGGTVAAAAVSSRATVTLYVRWFSFSIGRVVGIGARGGPSGAVVTWWCARSDCPVSPRRRPRQGGCHGRCGRGPTGLAQARNRLGCPESTGRLPLPTGPGPRDAEKVRLFAHGAGCFHLRTGGRVHAVVCGAGDLLSVPAGGPWPGGAPGAPAVRCDRTAHGTLPGRHTAGRA
jgi:hypothetical protein